MNCQGNVGNDMDIEKQAADLRCCGNCKHGGTKWDEETEQSYHGCGINTDIIMAGDPVCEWMVCERWTSDGHDAAWRLKQFKDSY
jgi:hypothetical protein